MQQVNLYLPEFQPKRDWFSTANLGLMAAAVLFVFMGLSVLQRLHLAELAAQVTLKEQRSKELAAQVQVLKQRPDVSDQRQRLEREQARIRTAIRNRENILVVMEGGTLGNQTGFSQHFTALSRKLPNDMALERFAFYQGGSTVHLAGESRMPENVPLYLSRLQQEPVFALSDFGDMRLYRRGGVLNFSFNQPQTDQDGAAVEVLRQRRVP